MKKDEGFFREFQRQMVRNFTLVGVHSISAPEDVKYHVDCTWARETTLVFHKRGLSFIIICSHHENDGVFGRAYHDYWKLDFIYNTKDYGELLKSLTKEQRDKIYQNWLYEETPFKFVGYNQNIEVTGFNDRGGSRSKHYHTMSYEGESTPELVVKTCASAFEQLRPVLGSGRFTRLPMYNFYDSYAFNDGYRGYNSDSKAEQLFRQRFDMKYLQTLGKLS